MFHKNIAIFLWITSGSFWQSDVVLASIIVVSDEEIIAVNQNRTNMIIYVFWLN